MCGVNLSQLYCRPLSARKSHYIPYFNGGEAPQSQELLQGKAHRDEKDKTPALRSSESIKKINSVDFSGERHGLKKTFCVTLGKLYNVPSFSLSY